eukprot:1235311-Pyramimonas_sp.AAC.1
MSWTRQPRPQSDVMGRRGLPAAMSLLHGLVLHAITASASHSSACGGECAIHALVRPPTAPNQSARMRNGKAPRRIT